MLGIKVPKKEFSDVLLVLKGLQKANPQPKKMADPMMPSILRKLDTSLIMMIHFR